MKIRWTDGARADLLRILSHIAADNPEAARKIKERFQAAISGVKLHPALGRVVPEFGDPRVRERVVAPYRIFYLVQSEIQVLAIYHGRQDLAGNE